MLTDFHYLKSVLSLDLYWYLKAKWKFTIDELKEICIVNHVEDIINSSKAQNDIIYNDINESHINNVCNREPTWNISINTDIKYDDKINLFLSLNYSSYTTDNKNKLDNKNKFTSINQIDYIKNFISIYFSKNCYTPNNDCSIVSKLKFGISDLKNFIRLDISDYSIDDIIYIIKSFVLLCNDLDYIYVNHLLNDFNTNNNSAFYLCYQNSTMNLLDFYIIYNNIPIFKHCWNLELQNLCKHYLTILYLEDSNTNEISLINLTFFQYKYKEDHSRNLRIYTTNVKNEEDFGSLYSYEFKDFRSYWNAIQTFLIKISSDTLQEQKSNISDDCDVNNNNHKNSETNTKYVSTTKYSDLKDTVDLMISSNSADRFKAEVIQLKLRINKLSKLLSDYKEDKLTFTPKSSYELLYSQLLYMNNYMDVLIKRAKKENIALNDFIII